MTLLSWTSFWILFDLCKSNILDFKLTSYYSEELCCENHLTLKTLSAFRNTFKMGLAQSALLLLWLLDLGWYYWSLAFLYIQPASGDLYFSTSRIEGLNLFIESMLLISSGFLNNSGNMAWGITQDFIFIKRVTCNYWLLRKGEPICICIYCICIHIIYKLYMHIYIYITLKRAYEFEREYRDTMEEQVERKEGSMRIMKMQYSCMKLLKIK